MPAFSPDESTPTWWDTIIGFEFGASGVTAPFVPEADVMAVVTDLMIAPVTSASGDFFIVTHVGKGAVWFQAERGAGNHDLFHWSGYMPLHSYDVIQAVSNGSSVWSLLAAGFWVPDYAAELI